ncbi:trimeric autotransporter adhesin, partial [Mesocricetibacter intestinalis]
MNKVFKVIWNQAIGAWVAVSELAKGHIKSSSSSSDKPAKKGLNKQRILTQSVIGSLLLATVGTVYGHALAGGSDGTGSAKNKDSNVIIGQNTKGNAANNWGDASRLPNIVLIGNNASLASMTGGEGLGNGFESTGVGAFSKVAEKSTALGYKADAGKVESVAMGWTATANQGSGATAVGAKSQALGVVSTALGHGAQATGGWATALGTTTQAKGASSVAISYAAHAHSDGSLAIGRFANSTGVDSVALGRGSTTKADRAVAIGSGIAGTNTDVVGAPQALAVDTISIGYQSVAKNQNSIAIGKNAQTQVDNGIALGVDSVANRGPGSVGYDISTNKTSTLSDSTWKATYSALSVGDTGKTRQITNVAAGSADTDAVNVAQLKKVADLVKQTPGGGTAYSFKIQANGGSSETVANGETVNFANGSNINITRNGKTVTVATTNDLNLTPAGSVNIGGTKLTQNNLTMGDTAFTNTGLTIKNGPSVTNTGINAGDKKITNVAPGTIGSGFKDAVNGDQLYNYVKVNGNPVANNGSVNFVNGTNTVVNAAGGNISYNVANTNLTTTNGRINTPSNSTAFVNAGDLVTAINNTYHTVNTATNNNQVISGANAGGVKVKAGDILTYSAGKNLEINQTGSTITYGLSTDINVSTVVATNSVTVGKTSVINGQINGINNNLPSIANYENRLPGQESLNKAANVQDVLNAGWNLRENDKTRDFVKTYDTVNFNDGDGTKVSIVGNNDGNNANVSNITVNVQYDNSTIIKDNKGNLTVNTSNVVKGDNNTTQVANGTVTVKTGSVTVNPNGTAKADDSNGIVATVTDVAKAVNDTYHTIKTATNDQQVVSGANATGTQVKAGSILTYEAGKNLEINQTGSTITYGLSKDITVQNITATSIKLGDTVVSNGTVSNLTNNLNVPTDKATSGTAPTLADKQGNNAATVNDVLNAGWNLRANDTEVDFVTAYDTVNFTNGSATVIEAVNTDGKTSQIKVNVKYDNSTLVTDGNGN